MQSEDNLDSDQTTTEKEQPSSNKVMSGDKRGSSSGQSAQTDLEKKLERLEAMVTSIQSGSNRAVDRMINSTKDELTNLREQFGTVTKLMKSRGISEDEAFDVLKAQKDDAEYKSAILEVRELLKGGKSIPAQAGEAKIDPSVAEIVKQYELDANDPDVVAKVLTLTDPKEAEFQALKMLHKRSASPSPSGASTVTPKPSHPATSDELIKNYQKDMIANRGKPEQIRAIKEQAIKNGVPVDSVSFT